MRCCSARKPPGTCRVPHKQSEHDVLPVSVARIMSEVNPKMVTTGLTADPIETERKLAGVQVSKEALTVELQRLSRGPFRDLLADFLTCAPTAQDIQRAAMKSPDRWAQALAIVAKLSGYHEKLEVEGTAKVATLSDVEIEEKLNAIIEERVRQLAKQETDERVAIPARAGSLDGRSECVGVDVPGGSGE